MSTVTHGVRQFITLTCVDGELLLLPVDSITSVTKEPRDDCTTVSVDGKQAYEAAEWRVKESVPAIRILLDGRF